MSLFVSLFVSLPALWPMKRNESVRFQNVTKSGSPADRVGLVRRNLGLEAHGVWTPRGDCIYRRRRTPRVARLRCEQQGERSLSSSPWAPPRSSLLATALRRGPGRGGRASGPVLEDPLGNFADMAAARPDARPRPRSAAKRPGSRGPSRGASWALAATLSAARRPPLLPPHSPN